jgi:hypothetical protein
MRRAVAVELELGRSADPASRQPSELLSGETGISRGLGFLAEGLHPGGIR